MGDKGVIFFSPDGEHWRKAQSATDQQLTAVAGNGSTWVAVGAYGDGTKGVIETSTDGVTWTNTSLDADVGAIAWGDSKWMAAGSRLDPTTHQFHAVTWTSTDGTTWTRSQPLEAPFGTDVAWNGHEWLFVDSFSVWASGNGIDWTVRNDHGRFGAIAWLGHRWMAIRFYDEPSPRSEVPGRGYVSADGRNWARSLEDSSGNITDVAAAC